MIETIHEAAAQVRAKKVTPLELVEQCLAAIDRYEPTVRAWVFVDRDYARAEARRLGDELARGQYRGPLHGIPVGIKDIFDVFDWPTAAGSELWARSIARADAPLVANLRRAGAIFLGKTVTTQFASFDPPVTRNPWNRERTPGGSSSGSAAGLATGMCMGALGSQTGGSITRPAAYCGVCGLKPTYGVLPLTGIVPLAQSMDHPGPMARCVRDLAILFQVLGPRYYTADAELQDYVTELGSLDAPPQLARFRGLFDECAEPGVGEALDETCKNLRTAGAKVRDSQPPGLFADVIQSHRVIMAVEGAAYHASRLERHPHDYKPNIRALIEEGLRHPSVDYCAAKDHQQTLSATMQSAVYSGTVLLTPAATGPAPDTTTTGNPAFNSPWSFTGLPTVNFPSGQFVQGLPLGLQLIANHGKERLLLQVAAWCEKALGIKPLTAPLQ